MAKRKRPRITGSGVGPAKKLKRPKAGGGGGTKKGGGGLKGLLSGQPLVGRNLGKAAGALTKLELYPGLKSYGREIDAIERQRAASETGLSNLGAQTSNRVAGVYGALKGASDQTVARQQALAQNLNMNQAAATNQSAQNLAGFQTGQLGGLTEALQSGNVSPGGSASQAALAQQAQAQQQAQAREGQAQAAFASAQGGAYSGLAAGQAQAGQMRGAEAQTDIASMIAQRIADSNRTHREAALEAYGKKADLKATWGASKLKNLLQLRQGERDYDIARNPPAKTSNVNNKYFGLSKKAKITAKGMKDTAKIQGQTQAGANKTQIGVAQQQGANAKIKAQGLNKYGKSVGGGGGKRKRQRR